MAMIIERWRSDQRRSWLMLICLLLSASALLGMASMRWSGVQAATDSGPDLTVEIQVIPAVPNPGETATVRMIFRNRGTATSSPATFYFYVNPADRPPTPATAPSYFSGVPSLPLGGSFQFDRDVTFGSAGCDHIVYAWVDRDNMVTDADRSNNLVGLPVCVGDISCVVDNYEGDVGDNNRVTARWFMENFTQARTLCDAQSSATPDRD